MALVDAARISFRLWRRCGGCRRPIWSSSRIRRRFPTLMVTRFTLVRRGVRFVIDWHNLGYTLLRLRLGRWHPAVRLARWLERRDARRVDCAPLRVSRPGGISQEPLRLLEHRVLYDRPASVFVADRARRARAIPSGVVHAARHHAGRRRFHRLSDELDGRRGLRRRHRRRADARGADSRLGSARKHRRAFPISSSS